MSWVVFSLGAWIMLGLEQGLRGALQIPQTSVAPSFLGVYSVFIACSAPPRAAQWGCLALGLLMDLSSPFAPLDSALFTVAGPNALGALLMCQFVLAVRGLMFRRNPLTLAFLSCVGFAVWQAVVTAVFTVRGFAYQSIEWSPAGQLGSRLASSLYTGIVAIPVALLLILLMPLFAFQFVPYRFAQKR
ncbi:MAG TPA: hypothetical protein VFF69_10285 [Phycisphaerales bacterium]|nr:hypothetical protein [Phycisphaerales bacterium]